MAVNINIFIEVKNKTTKKWELVKIYKPFVEGSYDKYLVDNWVKVEKKPDIISIDDKKFEEINSITKGGYIVNVISGAFSEFKDRGLPKDLSSELNYWFVKKQSNLDLENRMYYNKYKVENNFKKWWYGETYVTLDELDEHLQNEYKEWKDNIKKAFDDKYTKSQTNKDLKQILSILNKTQEDNTEDNFNEFENEEYIEELLNDNILDIMELNDFTAYVKTMADMYSEDYEDIRIVSFLS